MRLRRGTNRERLELGGHLATGGEAHIYLVTGEPRWVAKIYHTADDRHWAKLRAMLENPPDDPMAARGHCSIAWPVDILENPGTGKPVGFLMPRLDQPVTVYEYFNPGQRRKRCPAFHYEYLLTAALNIATAVDALHARGHVVGDVNESNVLVTDAALATLVDTDSFQVRGRDGSSLHRCLVGKPEYTPPELQGKRFEEVERTTVHDHFGLAVLIFQMLMEGTHPFDGKYTGSGDPPQREERILAGQFPYSIRRKVQFAPKALAPPLEMLHPAVRELLVTAFDQGHADPAARPRAKQWRDALSTARTELAVCAKNGHHRHYGGLRACPWCERAAQLGGLDPFPSADAIRAGTHASLVSRTGPVRSPVVPVAVVTPQPQAQPPPVVPTASFPPWWAGPAAGALFGVTALVFGSVVIALLGLMATAALWLLDRRPRNGVAAVLSGVLTAGLFITGLSSKPAPPVANSQSSPEASKVEPLPPVRTQVNPTDGQTYVWIQPGKFSMGCSPGDSECFADEKPAKEVTIAKGFWMGQTEVTQGAYQKVMGNNPANVKGDKRPVENVSWNDATAYCGKAGVRLPTEEEWEYAARGGTTGARYAQLDDIAWYNGNSGGRTHDVMTRTPNAFGLYDVLGNVWEWTASSYNQSGNKVLRGGSWDASARSARVSFRSGVNPGFGTDDDGFRCAGDSL